jgi:spore maturation protein SpmA
LSTVDAPQTEARSRRPVSARHAPRDRRFFNGLLSHPDENRARATSAGAHVNVVFSAIVVVAILCAAFLGSAAPVGKAALDGAKQAVELAIGLTGYMALFLGLMKIVEEAGGLAFMTKLIRPLLIRLFPDVPADHPAMGAMVMNLAANALGLANAATPFGLKAMKELHALSRDKPAATNAMVLFLAINTSGLALLPTGIIGLRALHHSVDPAAIFPTTLLATAISTVVGVMAAKFYARLPFFAVSREQAEADAEIVNARTKTSMAELIPLLIFLVALMSLVAVVYSQGEAASAWILPGLIGGMVLLGVARKVKVYEVFIAGAKDGFAMGITIIPYLVAILAAVGMFRASGGMQIIVDAISPLTSLIGLPAEALPLALLRPLSGSGAFALTAEVLVTHGPDSYLGNLVSTMQGSTETTFYVLAVYFGSVGVVRLRHAVFAGLTADFAGVLGSLLAVRLLLS